MKIGAGRKLCLFQWGIILDIVRYVGWGIFGLLGFLLALSAFQSGGTLLGIIVLILTLVLFFVFKKETEPSEKKREPKRPVSQTKQAEKKSSPVRTAPVVNKKLQTKSEAAKMADQDKFYKSVTPKEKAAANLQRKANNQQKQGIEQAIINKIKTEKPLVKVDDEELADIEWEREWERQKQDIYDRLDADVS